MRSLAYLRAVTSHTASQLTPAGTSPRLRSGLLGLALLAAAGCTAGTKPTLNGTGGTTGGSTGPLGGSGGGAGAVAGTTGLGGGPPGLGGGGGSVTPNPDAGSCLTDQVVFVPKNPTVILLVDRSGSMFDCISTQNLEASCPDLADTTWTKLKDGILPVVEQLQGDVRFGFATISGSNPSNGGTCPNSTPVAPKLNNYADIRALYDSLPPAPNSTQSGVKWETPTRQLLQTVGDQLIADTTPGDKYILFITDGEPDYCGDGNALCPPDAVVWQLQRLKQSGITTIVFGLKATIAQDLPAGVLEAFANAGAGEATVAPLRTGATRLEDFFDQCFMPGGPATESPGGWTADFLSVPGNASCATDRNPCRGRTLGTYSATAGPTMPYRPDVTNQQALINQLSMVLSGVKSCGFDLMKFMVDTNRLAEATIKVDGNVIPLDPNGANGWNMTSPTHLELYGSACETWRNPSAMVIDFGFPCTIIVD